MMIMVMVYRGIGPVVLALPIVIFVAILAVTAYVRPSLITGEDGSSWMLTVTLLLSGVILWLLGRSLNRRRASADPQRFLCPPDGSPFVETEAKRSAQHTWFLIPIEYWGVAFAVLAIALLLMD